MSKTFELQTKLGLFDGANVSILNGGLYNWYPYYISNPTGCAIKKIKVMIGEAEFGGTGGTIELELYHKPINEANTIESKLDITKLMSDDGWALFDTIQYTSTDSSVAIRSAYKISNTILTEPSYIIGALKVTGDVKATDLFVWIDYENNPVT